MNYELWANEMEELLCSTLLWNFLKEGFVYPYDKRKFLITLFIIISRVYDNILSSNLYEFGQRT